MIIAKINAKNIARAIKILKNNGIIVYPTDTAYALGGFFDSKKAISRILKIKKRKNDKFTIIASGLNQVRKYFKLNPVQVKLAKKYWPGPFSLVVSPKFAVRVPDNSIARKLARSAGRPLIATSANLSGQTALYSGQEVIKEFAGEKYRPDLILAAGRLKKRKTSTIARVGDDGEIEILREGAVKLSDKRQATSDKD
ncbi:MAG: threonylcarbamoyl-AMP synthase [Candidatus Buchananbacteria bacterium RIFCSPLOWO2_02_FULL_46_11b]|uniref:L-threonylcarbamoyladenylate synthase n=2 Tax=Candidatus Buchananiibacteriota TaxID=1817903 RepID=A0A1G1YQ81_9BACT|nr:MAG: threonylcarbamoyl-AMP synthase [Candidatus Buchananbacteria bacterium RIFCSPLOWO2_01_FULL_45_31]OGY57996.1 MAG: threonylcarbamoyl-AMP synthase [Candidatus Buchananbacteria bacterium RIFCSPLOWO2_02_FULL_46_11b]